MLNFSSSSPSTYSIFSLLCGYKSLLSSRSSSYKMSNGQGEELSDDLEIARSNKLDSLLSLVMKRLEDV